MKGISYLINPLLRLLLISSFSKYDLLSSLPKQIDETNRSWHHCLFSRHSLEYPPSVYQLGYFSILLIFLLHELISLSSFWKRVFVVCAPKIERLLILIRNLIFSHLPSVLLVSPFFLRALILISFISLIITHLQKVFLDHFHPKLTII